MSMTTEQFEEMKKKARPTGEVTKVIKETYIYDNVAHSSLQEALVEKYWPKLSSSMGLSKPIAERLLNNRNTLLNFLREFDEEKNKIQSQGEKQWMK